MPVARLAEAPDQDVVACLQEEDLGRDVTRLECADRLLERNGRVARARIENERKPLVAGRLARNELGKVAQQLGRQVVDDPVADVLQQLARRSLAGTGEAADDRDPGARLLRFRRGGCRLAVAHYVSAPSASSTCRGRFERPTRKIVSSYSGYMTRAMMVGLIGSPPGVTTTAMMKILTNT